jgi:hypothetical protein
MKAPHTGAFFYFYPALPSCGVALFSSRLVAIIKRKSYIKVIKPGFSMLSETTPLVN